MSVKSKVKRCNEEIKRLEGKIFVLENENRNLERIKRDYISEEQNFKLYKNIVKFALTNHIGNLEGGMRIEARGIDKMEHLRLFVDYEPQFNSYIIRVHY